MKAQSFLSRTAELICRVVIIIFLISKTKSRDIILLENMAG